MVDAEWRLRAQTALEDRCAAFADRPEGRRVFDELNPDIAGTRPYARDKLKKAAVLAPIVMRSPEPTVLLTVRTADMPSHPGQISLPGGRIQAEDAGPVEAALRETWEETGIHPDFVTPIGALEIHEGGMGYSVTPVVGLVQEGFTLSLCEREVSAAFEVPLSHVLDADRYSVESRFVSGRQARFRCIVHEERQIWGLTATILHSLQDALLGVA